MSDKIKNQKSDIFNSKVGSALVVGGGIGGMQAALDLAGSGIKVYLAESKPCIGGIMAQLDKTFPTNDCSMCIMAPKLVEIGRHKDIDIITLADVEGIKGNAGNFKVTIKKRARYIYEEKCTGCGECAEACPVELPNEFDVNLGKRKAIYRLFPQAVPNKFAIDKKDLSPCRNACPAGCDNQAYIALISQGKFKEALEVIRERIPLPAICGRTCNAPCEDNCNRNKVDEALSIRALKRFAADYEMYNWHKEKETEKGIEKNDTDKVVQIPKKNKKVAVIGSGPAGLTVSYDLAKMGYQVVIFEATQVAGGMLRLGIPKFRLPPEVIDYEIEIIKKAGVEILTNTAIGPDMTLNDLFNRGYEAIFIAIGTHKSLTLNIEGENLDGVIHGVGFLQSVGTGREVDFKDKVVAVIGGGNVAVDSVRTALRFGAKEAFIIYRRSEKELLMKKEELLEAKSEGVKIHSLLAPTRILGDIEDRVIGVECMPMKLGPPDESGRPRPIPDETKEKVIIKADIAIPAIGQFPDLSTLGIGMVQPELAAKEMPARWHIMPLEGGNLEGVSGFTDFLQAVSLGRKVKVGEKILVVGGGNVALDVARTALRLGGKEVSVICLEKIEEMPAHKFEIKEAEEEGIKILDSLGPKKILGDNGKAIGLETLDCISVFDEKGKFNPKLKERTEKVIEADTIIVAIGQVVDYSLLRAADGVLLTERGLLKVDKTTYATNVTGIFAGGDVVSGPGFVVDAIAQGHEAAVSIDRYLRGEDIKKGREKLEKKLAALPERKIEYNPRVEIPKLSPQKRILGFDEIELGYDEAQAIAEAKRCLNCGGCSECLQCVEVCKLEAIYHDMPVEELIEIDVGAIVMAPGYKIFDAKEKLELGYGRFPNVVTAIEFERILSASGPYSGKVRRPSDDSAPKRIAFIQCVGSRETERDYCSSACCMFATKEAIIAMEHEHGIECTIFFIDMRAFGKGFDAYYERAKQLGIKYIRCRPSSIKEIPGTKNLKIQYQDVDNKIKINEYDLVVLSTGFEPPDDVKNLSDKLSINLNKYNFCETSTFNPVESSRKGIYVCGPFAEPKDIPETVMQASGSVSKVLTLLKDVKGSLTKPIEYPPEINVTGQEPRIGVFVCHCGTNIGGVVDVPDVVEYAKTLPNVVYAENNLYTCSNDTQDKIKEKIKEHNLNRVIVASCSPRTHEPLFRNTMREVGLNPYLFEMANIRDQCSWVHMSEHEKATVKSKDLVRMAVAKSRLLEPLYEGKVGVERSALIIGGGLSGITSALGIANQGFDVYLVEKENKLGGNLNRIHYLINKKEKPQEKLKFLIDEVKKHNKIHLFTSAEIKDIDGSIGNFTTKISINKDIKEFKHGVVIVATGAKEYKPKEYLYGEDKRVITQLELEEKICSSNSFNQKTVVMIQCVGSRDEERPYCSRICCTDAVKNALKIKEISPDTDVYILYRDIRTYGFRESYYSEAREKGVLFLRHEDDQKPEVSIDNGSLKVKVFEPVMGMPITIDSDLLVLSAAIVPDKENNKTIDQFLKVP
ncbi:MAG: FAD-dependent oxidoreductase, partial [Candidatus Humimicrobiaceae bacterium]